jgi:hypothetical protein
MGISIMNAVRVYTWHMARVVCRSQLAGECGYSEHPFASKLAPTGRFIMQADTISTITNGLMLQGDPEIPPDTPPERPRPDLPPGIPPQGPPETTPEPPAEIPPGQPVEIPAATPREV